MSTKITAIFDNPTDPDAFEAGYPAVLEFAKAMPGLQRLESAKVWPKEDGSPRPAYRLLEMYFADYDSASAAVRTPQAAALVPSMRGVGTGGLRIVFADVETV